MGTLEYPLVTRRKLGKMGGVLGYRSHVLFLDLEAGFTGVFSLKFIKLYNYDIHPLFYMFTICQ